MDRLLHDAINSLSDEELSRRGLMRRIGVIGGAAGLAMAAGSATQPEPVVARAQDAGEPKSGGVLRSARQGWSKLEPQIDYVSGSQSVQLNVYDTLISYDNDGFLTGSLAESWETPDEVTYIFHIRQGVTFHDGSPFTAEDVIFSFDRMLDESTLSARRPELERMASYEATDEYTVQVVMKEPYATFLSVLANRAATMVSRSFEGDYATEMNGTGPFMLESFEPDVETILVKNPNYWKPGMPYVDRYEVIGIPDDNARINALKSGAVNFSEYIPYQYVDELEADGNFSVYEGYDIYNYIRLNVNRAPMDNPLVRQALNYAVDRDMVINLAFGGRGVPTTAGLIPPNDPVWFQESLDGHWYYDPAKALELLAEAGYENPADLKFTLECSSEPNHLDSAQIIVETWRALGIDAELLPLESAVRVDKRYSGDYTIMFDGAANPWTDPDFYSQYIASEGSVYAAGIGFSDPEIDRLLAEGRAELDEAARKEIYLQVETRMLELAPFVFINFRPQAEACAANVKGYVRVPGVGAASTQFMEQLWIDDES